MKTPIAADLIAIGVPATKRISSKNVASQVSSAKQALCRQDYIGPNEMTVRVELYSNDLINFIELAWMKYVPGYIISPPTKAAWPQRLRLPIKPSTAIRGIFENNEGT